MKEFIEYTYKSLIELQNQVLWDKVFILIIAAWNMVLTVKVFTPRDKTDR